jgi:hypothetical protein
MERIVHAVGVHFTDGKSVGLNHDFGITGFEREADVVVVVAFGDADKFEGTFDHTVWGVAVAIHDAVRE